LYHICTTANAGHDHCGADVKSQPAFYTALIGAAVALATVVIYETVEEVPEMFFLWRTLAQNLLVTGQTSVLEESPLKIPRVGLGLEDSHLG
jgi:hypothetical protein